MNTTRQAANHRYPTNGIARFYLPYRALAWGLTGLLLLSILPRAWIPWQGFQLYAGETRWGHPVLGVIGLVLLPGIAYAVGRGRVVSTILAYVALQGTMRRFLITDCSLPRFLVVWDNVPVVLLFASEMVRRRFSKINRIAWYMLLALLISAGMALLSVIVNAVPLENAVLGFWRSVVEGPMWLIVLLLVRLPRGEKTRLFFELSTVLLIAHLGAGLASMISGRGFAPGDALDGVYGWGGHNLVSLTGGMMLLFLSGFPTRSKHSTEASSEYLPGRAQKARLLIGWGFLFVWAASRFALMVVPTLFLIWLVLKNMPYLLRHRLSRKYVRAIVLLVLVGMTFVFLQVRATEVFSATYVAKNLSAWLQDWSTQNENDVNRGVITQYNLELLSRQPETWVWGVGPGMYRSATGNTLQPPLVREMKQYWGGRYVAPMYLTDMLVEYGIPGLGLILLVPALTVIGLPWRTRSKRHRHPAQAGYVLVGTLVFTSLIAFSTLEHRGVTLLMYLIAAVVLSRKETEPGQVRRSA